MTEQGLVRNTAHEIVLEKIKDAQQIINESRLEQGAVQYEKDFWSLIGKKYDLKNETLKVLKEKLNPENRQALEELLIRDSGKRIRIGYYINGGIAAIVTMLGIVIHPAWFVAYSTNVVFSSIWYCGIYISEVDFMASRRDREKLLRENKREGNTKERKEMLREGTEIKEIVSSL